MVTRDNVRVRGKSCITSTENNSITFSLKGKGIKEKKLYNLRAW
jgi:hypothetical protein